MLTHEAPLAVFRRALRIGQSGYRIGSICHCLGLSIR